MAGEVVCENDPSAQTCREEIYIQKDVKENGIEGSDKTDSGNERNLSIELKVNYSGDNPGDAEVNLSETTSDYHSQDHTDTAPTEHVSDVTENGSQQVLYNNDANEAIVGLSTESFGNNEAPSIGEKQHDENLETILENIECNEGNGIPYALERYLKTADHSIQEEKIDGETLYDDYLIISPDDLLMAENNLLRENDTYEEFAEIELSDIGCDLPPIEEVSVEMNEIIVPVSHEIVETSIHTDENDILNDTLDTDTPQVDTGNLAPSTLSTHEDVDEVSSLIENNSEKSSIIDVPIIQKKTKFVFPVNNIIYITLKYSINSKDILGNIRSIKGLGYEATKPCPETIRFHLTILPQNSHRAKTKWVHASVRSLAWKFMIGPLRGDIDTTGKHIRFRLYGKSNKVLSRCYGECFIPLADVIEAEKSQEFEREILPKGTLKHMNIKCRKNTNATKNSRPPSVCR